MQFPLHTLVLLSSTSLQNSSTASKRLSSEMFHFYGKSRVTPPFLLTNAHLYTDVCYRIPKALSGLLCSTKALTFCTSKDYDSSCVDRVGSRACVAGRVKRKNIYIRWRLGKMQLIDTPQHRSLGHYKLTPSTLRKCIIATLSRLLKVLYSSLDLFNQTSFLPLWEAPTHVTIDAPKLIAQISTTVYRQLFVHTAL